MKQYYYTDDKQQAHDIHSFLVQRTENRTLYWNIDHKIWQGKPIWRIYLNRDYFTEKDLTLLLLRFNFLDISDRKFDSL